MVTSGNFPGLILTLFLLLSTSNVKAVDSYNFYAQNWPSGLHENVHKYHLGQGKDKLENGSYEYAMGDANFILARFPNDPKGLQLAMNVALDWPEKKLAAMPYFEKALRKYPQHGETWLIYGVYLHRLERMEKAVKAYKTAIEKSPSLAEAHYNLGLALVELGMLEKANQAAQKAYQLGYPLPGLREKLQKKDEWEPNSQYNSSG